MAHVFYLPITQILTTNKVNRIIRPITKFFSSITLIFSGTLHFVCCAQNIWKSFTCLFCADKLVNFAIAKQNRIFFFFHSILLKVSFWDNNVTKSTTRYSSQSQRYAQKTCKFVYSSWIWQIKFLLKGD